MIVILNRDVKGTGKAGDVVKVSDGYARNMLLPRGYATEATDGNIRSLEKQKAIAAEKAAAQAIAEKLSSLTVKIQTKAGENGKVFGSITSKDIAEKLKEQHKITVDKKKILLDGPIKQTGTVSIDVKLYPEVTGKLTVEISAE